MAASSPIKILAPLRGVTIPAFREVFADAIREYGFTEAITPFITANQGYDPLRDRELCGMTKVIPCQNQPCPLSITPQFIGKDPAALRYALERVKSAGFVHADLNCGCPFPMVRNKGRGSGLLRTPEVLEAMIATGCEVMGPGNFSIKTRLGVEKKDELLKLMPIINRYPLRFLTVHPRTAKQMYEGEADLAAYREVAQTAAVPLILNGPGGEMIGRPFIRSLGERADAASLLNRYIEVSKAELCGENPVLGRIKELLTYWKDLPRWSRRWDIIKMCRSLDELKISLDFFRDL